MLRKWLEEEKPGEYYPCQKKAANIHLSQSQKEQAAVDMRMKTKSSEEIAEKYNTTVHSLYYWDKKFLTKEIPKPMAGKRRVPETQEEAEAIIEDGLPEEPDMETVIVKRRKKKGKREADLKNMESLPPEYHELSETRLAELFPKGYSRLEDDVYREC